MSEPQFTDGPWAIRGKMLGFDYSIVNPDGDAEMGNWLLAGVRWREDAQLFVAAQDLYEAAALACLMFERKNVSTADSDWMGDDEHEAWSALSNALAKARGESPESDIEARRRRT